uniref:RNase H type-1 domain-containing protein n=1 Tax=Cannabis sativa TaxID=3483 RepID=A0A803Q7E0_CANSA
MSVFLLPFEIGRNMKQHMENFWWKTSNSKDNIIHWMSWERLSKHKSAGGMGFRNLRHHNLSLLGKQGWHFLTRPDSLASRIFKARYFPWGTYLTAQLGNNQSFVWRSIWEAQSVVNNGVHWKIGDGKSVSVLGDRWLPNDVNPCVTSSHPALNDIMVENLFKVDGVGWDLEIVNVLFNVRDKALICGIPIQANAEPNSFYWFPECSVYARSANLMMKPFYMILSRALCATTFDSTSNDIQCLVVVLCWAIWKAWNDKSSQLAAGDGAEWWRPPVSNGVKVNVDAAVFEGSQGYGFGAVARNEIGYLIEGFTGSYLGVVRPELAEAIGVREALSWIKAKRCQQVTLESDCLLAIQAI